ncbi:MAG TPA: DUF418 domain-containing protein [Burkholderiaceae bacterium]|nr:DUF418 domain-containing protein [Burkholderiaceae bacterium]
MTPSSAGAPARDERIDALRGFALLGILLVNIQSFLYGATNPIGYIAPDAGALDRVVYFATAAFVNLKFMPLFAMLFGAGFSLLYAKLSALTDVPKRIYRRRMFFLFVFGVVHGVFFYFGDITHMYALAGLVLLLYVDKDAAGIGRAALYWWIGAAIFSVLVAGLLRRIAPLPEELAPLVQANFAGFVGSGYRDQLALRAGEFSSVVIGNLFGFPMTVALMLTGMLAQRAGWLQDRGARAWQTAARLGLLLGVPAGLLYGYWALVEATANGFGSTTLDATVPQLLSVTLAFFYAASFFRHAPDSIVRLLAPAGRMPLTNYLLQSIAMGAVLSGWGLALGPQLGYWQTAALAAMIFVCQVLLSRLWLGTMKMKQGPLEALWRAWTYRGWPSGL